MSQRGKKNFSYYEDEFDVIRNSKKAKKYNEEKKDHKKMTNKYFYLDEIDKYKEENDLNY